MTDLAPPSLRRHEIPTHLGVEDRAFLGLSVRQVLCLLIAAAGSYGLSQQWPALPVGLRVALAGACFLLLAAFVLVRPGGRALIDWAVVALCFATAPKRSTWRPAPPLREVPQPSAIAGEAWVEWAPMPGWTADADQSGQDAPSDSALHRSRQRAHANKEVRR